MRIFAPFTLFRPFAIPTTVILALILSTSLLLLRPLPSSAFSCDDPPAQIGSRESDRRDEQFEPTFRRSTLDVEISLSAGYLIFFEEDMYDTYGGLPLLGAEALIGTRDAMNFVIGLGYGSNSGDPFYDSPEFEGGELVKLRAIPISVGFRTNSSLNPRFRLNWGACFEAVWMEERVPDLEEVSGESYRSDRGWGKGLTFRIMPEWRSLDQRRSLGLTFIWGGSSGSVGKGYDSHEVNLIGMGARVHYTQAL